MKLIQKVLLLSRKNDIYFFVLKSGYSFYVYLQTTQGKGGAYFYDIHFWIGKDTSQVSLDFQPLPYFKPLSYPILLLFVEQRGG